MNSEILTQRVDRKAYETAASDFRLSPFQESAWLEALSGPWRRPAYFEFSGSGRCVGLAAGLEVTSRVPWLSGLARHLYLYGFPEVLPEYAKAALSSFMRFLRDNAFNTLDVAYYDNASSLRVEDYGLRARPAIEYRIDLRPSLDELQRTLNRLRHRLIKRALQNALVYEESRDSAKLADLKLCLGQTKARRAQMGVGRYHYYYIPHLDEPTLGRLLESGLGRVCTVSGQAGVVSAGFFVRNRQRTYHILAGATREGYDLGASTYMQWRVIEQSKVAGCEWLNLGGVPHDSSADRLIQFKESFGARPVACQAGSCYLLGPLRMWLHRAYKVASNPAALVSALRADRCTTARQTSAAAGD